MQIKNEKSSWNAANKRYDTTGFSSGSRKILFLDNISCNALDIFLRKPWLHYLIKIWVDIITHSESFSDKNRLQMWTCIILCKLYLHNQYRHACFWFYFLLALWEPLRGGLKNLFLYLFIELHVCKFLAWLSTDELKI